MSIKKIYKRCKVLCACTLPLALFLLLLLLLCTTVNLLDRHVERHPNKTAIIWERDEQGDFQTVTYK